MRLLTALLLLLSLSINAKEIDTSKPWCIENGGEPQIVLFDRTEVDCLMEYHAVEADFAHKWYEAVGQSLHYAAITGKLPGILLIVKNVSDRKYVRRLYAVINEYQLPITVWVTKDRAN